MSGEEDTQYFYVKADPDHYDLEDIFKGKYLKNRKEWRFEKKQEEEVTRFLYCSSSESEEGLEDKFVRSDSEGDDTLQISDAMKRRQRDRLHRANSFNASDTSDEEHESIDAETVKKMLDDIEQKEKDLEELKNRVIFNPTDQTQCFLDSLFDSDVIRFWLKLHDRPC